MKLMRKVGLVVSLGLVSSLASADNIYDLTGLGGPVGSKYVYTIDVVTGVSGYFKDEFIFSVPTGFSWDVYAFSMPNSTDVTAFLGISFRDNFSEVYSEEGGSAESFSNFYLDMPDLGFQPTFPGVYSLFVEGNSLDLSGEYSLEIKLSKYMSISTVPEPSSIALMLGGLGLVGFMAARRRNKHCLGKV